MSKLRIVATVSMAAILAACNGSAPPVVQSRPVRTVAVQHGGNGETLSLTGHIRAKDQVNRAFRLDGRVIERPVNVGDVVVPGQVVARLDPRDEQNALRSAQANLVSANAQLAEARLTYGRKQQLVKDGWVSRAQFDSAEQAFRTAQAQVASAEAQLRVAQDQLGYTVLTADAAGAVTAIGAEPGEVVRAGQMVAQIARDGGRDAVFDVPEPMVRTGPRDPLVEIALAEDPSVKATGRVREVAPQADATTRTFQVKVGITDPPAAMRLGATVTGRITLSAPPGFEVPASALTEASGRPAVWVVDPKSQAVALRGVDVDRYEPASVVISHGLETGELVVTAGVQTLRPGQKVSVLGAAS